MTPELQKAIADFLGWLQTGAQNATSFAKQQIPDLLAQQIAYVRAIDTLLVIGGIVAGILLLRLCLRWATKYQTQSREWQVYLRDFRAQGPAPSDGFNWGVASILSGIGSAIGFFVALASIAELVKVWFAPKVYLLEWILSLRK